MHEKLSPQLERWEQDFEPIQQILFLSPETVVHITEVINTAVELGRTREHGQRLILMGIEHNRLELTQQLDLQLARKSIL